jgi:hypothetical protein
MLQEPFRPKHVEMDNPLIATGPAVICAPRKGAIKDGD